MADARELRGVRFCLNVVFADFEVGSRSRRELAAAKFRIARFRAAAIRLGPLPFWDKKINSR